LLNLLSLQSYNKQRENAVMAWITLFW